MLTSCVDTVILPDDKTVDEDFWKSKSDVQLMVNCAYRSMLSTDIVKRLIVWGDLRSDELLPVATVQGGTAQRVLEDLIEINTGNTQYDNEFATWNAFYSVINNCNLVLARAGAVMSEDPSYTEGDYLADCSQMLALRSLCYFYLVRAYRDVPYTAEAFMNSSQDMDIPQSAPETVLRACIADLEQAEKNAISPLAYTDWRRVGYFTRDGIQALLADIYLWLGSVNRNAADYAKAVEYCDKVIDSKRSQYLARQRNSIAAAQNEFPLLKGNEMFDQLFVSQNGEESIFELQYNGTNSNTAVCEMFNSYANGRSTGYLQAPTIFSKSQTVYTTAGTSANDFRAIQNTYKSTGDQLDIRKMVAQESQYLSGASGEAQAVPGTRRAYSSYRQNYVIYRLTDVMLMKAEALMAQATSDDDASLLQPAFHLVQVVNLRSKDSESDSLKWNTYKSGVSTIENLILAERLRELAFEGKRWYDLLRYNYRHTAVMTDYKSTLAEINDRKDAFVPTTNDMLQLMARKLGSQGTAVSAKLGNEATLYMPVPKSDLEVCPVLKQNPAYSTSNIYEKNY
jgi:hypothetical protein